MERIRHVHIREKDTVESAVRLLILAGIVPDKLTCAAPVSLAAHASSEITYCTVRQRIVLEARCKDTQRGEAPKRFWERSSAPAREPERIKLCIVVTSNATPSAKVRRNVPIVRPHRALCSIVDLKERGLARRIGNGVVGPTATATASLCQPHQLITHSVELY